MDGRGDCYDPVGFSAFCNAPTGTDFPAAITGGMLAAKHGSRVLLTYGPASVPVTSPQKLLDDFSLSGLVLYGGTGAIGAATDAWMEAFFR